MPATATTEQRPRGGYRRVLEITEFRHLWFAEIGARLGESIASAALPLFVYDLTGSASLMSVILIIQMLPRAILAPFTGVMADRLDRKKLMLWASIVRCAAIMMLPFCSAAWQVAVVAAIAAVGTVVNSPAEMAVLPTIVPDAELVPALSLTQVMGSVLRVVGPALGASLYALGGARAAFGTQTVCLLVAIFWLWRLQVPHTPAEVEPGTSIFRSVFADIADGLRTVWQMPIVRGICGVEMLWSLIGASISIAAVVFAKEALQLGDRSGQVYGVMAGMMALGAVVGALFASRIEYRIGRPAMLAAGYLGPLALVPLAFVPPLPVVFACWLILGFADALAVIAFQAYMAERVPDSHRGRVYAIWGGLISATMLVSFSVIGWLTDRIGPADTLALAGLVVGLGGPLFLYLSGALPEVLRKQPVPVPLPEPVEPPA